MGPEKVTIIAGAGEWSAFEEVKVTASYKQAARTFSAKIAAELGPYVARGIFKDGAACSILFNGALVCAGFIDRYQPIIEGHATASITVSGRGKGQDFIDSSVDHKTGQFKNKSADEIAKEIDAGGVGVYSNRKLEKHKNHRVTPGETQFRCIEKLCRKEGMTMTGQADGKILITDGLQGMHAGGLIEGVNILRGEADHNSSGRHDKVIVRGQRAIGHGKDALEIEGEAKDATIKRKRPLVLVQDDDTDKGKAKKRAKTRRDREAGHGLKANVTVQGFRDDGGKLWEPGFGVMLKSPFLDIDQLMLIESAEFTQTRDGGSLTALSLVDPKAYGGQGGKGGSSGASWQSGAGGD